MDAIFQSCLYDFAAWFDSVDENRSAAAGSDSADYKGQTADFFVESKKTPLNLSMNLKIHGVSINIIIYSHFQRNCQKKN